MVEFSPQPLSAWWPGSANPLSRFGTKVADYFSPASDAAAADDAHIVEVELPGVKSRRVGARRQCGANTEGGRPMRLTSAH